MWEFVDSTQMGEVNGHFVSFYVHFVAVVGGGVCKIG